MATIVYLDVDDEITTRRRPDPGAERDRRSPSSCPPARGWPRRGSTSGCWPARRSSGTAVLSIVAADPARPGARRVGRPAGLRDRSPSSRRRSHRRRAAARGRRPRPSGARRRRGTRRAPALDGQGARRAGPRAPPRRDDRGGAAAAGAERAEQLSADAHRAGAPVAPDRGRATVVATAPARRRRASVRRSSRRPPRPGPARARPRSRSSRPGPAAASRAGSLAIARRRARRRPRPGGRRLRRPAVRDGRRHAGRRAGRPGRRSSSGPIPTRPPSIAEGGVVPADASDQDFTASGEFPATGKRVVQTKATGTRPLDELRPDGAVHDPAGTVVRTGSGIGVRDPRGGVPAGGASCSRHEDHLPVARRRRRRGQAGPGGNVGAGDDHGRAGQLQLGRDQGHEPGRDEPAARARSSPRSAEGHRRGDRRA